MSGDKQRTVGGRTHDRLQHDILYGEFAAGDRLNIGRLCARYHVSANTLREVLVRLSQVGLVEAEGQKGFRVAPANLKKLEELTRLRQLLEVDGALQSIRNGDLDWESNLAGAYYKLCRTEEDMLAGGTNVESWTASDLAFHLALIDACNSALHLQVYEETFLQFRRYVVQELKTHGFRGEPLHREHEEIYQAALARDEARLRRALELHINVYLKRERAKSASEPVKAGA